VPYSLKPKPGEFLYQNKAAAFTQAQRPRLLPVHGRHTRTGTRIRGGMAVIIQYVNQWRLFKLHPRGILYIFL
jgi:hypothetical protein